MERNKNYRGLFEKVTVWTGLAMIMHGWTAPDRFKIPSHQLAILHFAVKVTKPLNKGEGGVDRFSTNLVASLIKIEGKMAGSRTK